MLSKIGGLASDAYPGLHHIKDIFREHFASYPLQKAFGEFRLNTDPGNTLHTQTETFFSYKNIENTSIKRKHPYLMCFQSTHAHTYT